MISKNIIHKADCLEGLKTLPDNFVHCCVTSPPYWGLRDYGVDGQLGLEETPEAFVEKMVNIFTEVKRVLREDGTLWLNLGDSYGGSGKGHNNGESINSKHNYCQYTSKPFQSNNIKPKDLVGIPWMVALALRNSGWYLRQDIIWNKPNPMPESVKDRCTKAHEYIFLLSKSSKYFYDAEAIKTPVKDATVRRLIQDIENQKGSDRAYGGNRHNGTMKAHKPKRNPRPSDNRKGNQGTGGIPIGMNGSSFKGHKNYLNEKDDLIHGSKANKKSVWTVTTKGYKEAHFATYPEKLIVDCIKAGTSEFGCCSNCKTPYKRVVDKKLVPTSKASYNSQPDQRDFSADKLDQGSNRQKDGHKPGWVYKSKTLDWIPDCDCDASLEPCIVLDPFMGSGTTAIVAKKLNRNYIGFELNPEYIKIAEKRLYNEIGIFNT